MKARTLLETLACGAIGALAAILVYHHAALARWLDQVLR